MRFHTIHRNICICLKISFTVLSYFAAAAFSWNWPILQLTWFFLLNVWFFGFLEGGISWFKNYPEAPKVYQRIIYLLIAGVYALLPFVHEEICNETYDSLLGWATWVLNYGSSVWNGLGVSSYLSPFITTFFYYWSYFGLDYYEKEIRNSFSITADFMLWFEKEVLYRVPHATFHFLWATFHFLWDLISKYVTPDFTSFVLGRVGHGLLYLYPSYHGLFYGAGNWGQLPSEFVPLPLLYTFLFLLSLRPTPLRRDLWFIITVALLIMCTSIYLLLYGLASLAVLPGSFEPLPLFYNFLRLISLSYAVRALVYMLGYTRLRQLLWYTSTATILITCTLFFLPLTVFYIGGSLHGPLWLDSMFNPYSSIVSIEINPIVDPYGCLAHSLVLVGVYYIVYQWFWKCEGGLFSGRHLTLLSLFMVLLGLTVWVMGDSMVGFFTLGNHFWNYLDPITVSRFITPLHSSLTLIYILFKGPNSPLCRNLDLRCERSCLTFFLSTLLLFAVQMLFINSVSFSAFIVDMFIPGMYYRLYFFILVVGYFFFFWL